MLKIHNLKTIRANYETISYFYIREKCDPCGNSQFRVYILDSETPTVYETIFKCQEFQIADRVREFVENAKGEE